MPNTNVSKLRIRLAKSSPNAPHNGYLELTNPTATSLLETLILLETKKLKTVVLRPDDSFPSGLNSQAANEAALSGEGSIGLYTSGSTGVPKLHFQHLSALVSATKAGHPARAWGLLYSPSRMAGLQVVLQAFASNAKLVEPKTGSTLSEILHEFKEHGVDSLSATPSRWRSILGSDHLAGLALKHISLGGEIADQRLLDNLKEKFPQAAIRHIYATTETGPVFSVSDGVEGFPVEFLEREMSSGRRLEIINGELVVIVPATGQIPHSKSIFTGDLVTIRENRIIFFGRIGDVVNVGGVKVSLSEIEKHCNLLPGVIDSQARAIPNAFMGFLISIDIHWASDPLSDQEVRGHFRKSLPKAALPALIYSVNDLDLSANHKKKRVP
jgi:acyl-coenzyme A synthetase/AMP-(fatty) acid ligase